MNSYKPLSDNQQTPNAAHRHRAPRQDDVGVSQPPGLTILYADDAIVVVSKPSGLLSVPGRDPRLADCVAARTCARYPGATIVHRLDMETSGLMVLARCAEAHRNLSRQFERRVVGKTYIARVWGKMADEAGEIDAPLRCDWPNRPRQIVDQVQGKSAQTAWQVLAREEAGISRLQLRPKTGRSHQLRVHLLTIGHPILGDGLYATGDALKAADRLQLHAEQLSFLHPATNTHVSYICPCPF